MSNVDSTSNPIAFPRLEVHDLAILKPLSDIVSFSDGQVIFHAGDVDLDLFVVEIGGIKILNPSDKNRHIVTHGPGQFAGDIDLLTNRPVDVTGVASGETQLLRIKTTRMPVIECMNGQLLINPEIRKLAKSIGAWRHCPTQKADLVIIGGRASWNDCCCIVYAASEGLSTIVLDSIGPGGQAAGSSKIENFIGFSSGLTGTEFATKRVGFAVGDGSLAVTCVHKLVAIRS